MITMATLVTFVFTTLLTIAGEGAAIILIPTLNFLGYDLRIAMSTALLLNAIAMISASFRYYKNNLILFKIALPIVVVATIFSNLGAHVSHYLPNTLLNLLFICFLLFAATKMMLSSKNKKTQKEPKEEKGILSGIAIGVVAGFAAGLLGIGGGNLILPVLIGMGIESKNASATTCFIVIFSSLSGFLGHLGTGSIDLNLVLFTSIASISGALLGSWLMTDKLKSGQVKKVIAMVLVLVATKKLWNIVSLFI